MLNALPPLPSEITRVPSRSPHFAITIAPLPLPPASSIDAPPQTLRPFQPMLVRRASNCLMQQNFVLFRKALAKTSVHRIRCRLSKSPSLATSSHSAYRNWCSSWFSPSLSRGCASIIFSNCLTGFHKIRKAKNYGSHCSSDVLVHLARVEYENNLRIPKSLEKVHLDDCKLLES